jgi:preprotein translocase subunit YajC
LDPSILLLVVTGGLLIMLTLRGRRQRREQHLLQSRVTPGAEVMTASGLYATVVSLDDTVVVLRTGPGQESRWDRRAVVRVLSSPDEVAQESPESAEEPTPAEGSGNVIDDGDDTGRSKPS